MSTHTKKTYLILPPMMFLLVVLFTLTLMTARPVHAGLVVQPPSGQDPVNPATARNGLAKDLMSRIWGDSSLTGYLNDANGVYTIDVQRNTDPVNAPNTMAEAESWYNRLQMPVMIFAACALIIAGISFALSRGDSDKAEKARSAMAAAVAGFLVSVCCYGLISLAGSLAA
jgi:hypothetical protein